jgi:hypothetical protein
LLVSEKRPFCRHRDLAWAFKTQLAHLETLGHRPAQKTAQIKRGTGARIAVQEKCTSHSNDLLNGSSESNTEHASR